MRLLVIILVLIPCAAQAEESNPPAQACMGMLLEATQRQIEIRTDAIKWHAELIAAQQRVKALEDKYEPKK